MELLGIFHKKTFMEARGVCDAPYIEKGRPRACGARRGHGRRGDGLRAGDGCATPRRWRRSWGLMREERSLARIVLAAYRALGARTT